jgi:hypothetical protein
MTIEDLVVQGFYLGENVPSGDFSARGRRVGVLWVRVMMPGEAKYRLG